MEKVDSATIIDEETTCSNVNVRLEQLESELAFYKSRAEDLEISLEIANERWVQQVNENMALEIQVRKSRKA